VQAALKATDSVVDEPMQNEVTPAIVGAVGSGFIVT
jgi:hypothetical protein